MPKCEDCEQLLRLLKRLAHDYREAWESENGPIDSDDQIGFASLLEAEALTAHLPDEEVSA